MGILNRLKERRLFQIVASYLAAGWVALEVIDQLIDRGHVPEILYDVALVWYIGGIGGALLVGWYHGEKGKQKAPLSEVLAMGIIGMVVLGLSGFSVFGHVSQQRAIAAAEASALDLKRIAVPYFSDLTADSDLRHIADGFTEALIAELAAVRELDVLSRGAVAPYRGVRPPLDSLGRVLRAGTVIDGAVDRAGEDVRIVLRLVDGQSGVEFSRTSIQRPRADLLEARDAVVDEAARLLRELLGVELDLRDTRRATESLAAWILYQRAEEARKDAEEAILEGPPQSVDLAFQRADSLLAQSVLLDTAWAQPWTLRGHIAYRRSRIGTSLQEVLDWIDTGLGHADRALVLNPIHAAAFEVRGTLKYWHWLLNVIPDRERSDALFREARHDLERAVELDESLASAHASLAHLYLNAPDAPAAVLAGRKAYEEDAYLEEADKVIWRIVTGSFNLGQYREMAHWCQLGRDRFPDNFRFTACSLQAMTTVAAEPDVDEGWSLLARLDSLAPAHQAEWENVRGQLAMGGILARAGLADSARAVLDRAHARITPKLNPGRDLYMMEARMRTLLGEPSEAIELLKFYAAANPGSSFEQDGWWRALRSHPRWREVPAGS